MGIVIALLLAFASGPDWPPFHVVSPDAVFPPPSPEYATHTVSFSGHFAPNGGIATMEVRISYASGVTEDTQARILTKACRAKPSRLRFSIAEQAPLAIIDLDGDGRDEVFLSQGGATVDHAVLLRVHGCHVSQVETPNRKDDLTHPDLDLFYDARGMTGGGIGVLCRRTPSGRVEVLQIEHSRWTETDVTDPEHPVERANDHVDWTRRRMIVRGNRLVTIARQKGTSRIPNDPSVPLINRFDCLGSVYP